MTQNTKYFDVSNWQFFGARSTAREILEGSVVEQYAILEDYCKQLLKTNYGSTTKIQTDLVDGKRVFDKVYICLRAAKDRFIRGCRRIIRLHGCHLKGYCKGILLVAIGIDGSTFIFPIAYAVVGKENTESWTWFSELLKEDLHPTNPCMDTMMSDKQKGLQNAMEKILIGVDSRFCVRHMHNNFKKDFPGLLLKQILWSAARATTPAKFESRMKDVDEKAYNWLAAKNPSEWSKSHFKGGVKCDMLLNNCCKSFNNAIMEARDKTIVTLMESLRLWRMRRFNKNRENVDKWKNPVHNNIMKILEKQTEIATNCSVELATTSTF
uniref:MULE transposase domain-containing protein n=1 Tax=Cannabis sativa TaxID=3483 RepID=A0A803PC09_CANSA